MYTVLTLIGQVISEDSHLTTGGTVIMTGSVLLVLGLTAFCMARILRGRRS